MDQSELDRKYFVTEDTYNCPFCNRGSVRFKIVGLWRFDWNYNKGCTAFMIQCVSCEKQSVHFTDHELLIYYRSVFQWQNPDEGSEEPLDIDTYIFHSIPTSFFAIDERIPRQIREVIHEAEGCQKMNFLVGASACIRKTIYELLAYEKVEGDDYKSKIKALKEKHPKVDGELFDFLADVQGFTSDNLHEESWESWDSKKITFFRALLLKALHEI